MSAVVTQVIDLIPGRVEPLRTVRAAELTEALFWEQYVCRHEPVLIKGAATQWPASLRWAEPGYLESLCDGEQVLLNRTFNVSPPLQHAAEEVKSLKDSILEMRAASDDETLSMPAMAVPKRWLPEIGNYHFLQRRARAPLGYPGKRIFFYKNASTEWHYHQLDETLTSQLVGSKRISLFRLVPGNWNAYAPLIAANYHHMPSANRFFPKEPLLTKFEGVIEAGDAVYIPPFWWHGVDAASSEVGVTLAECFRSPLARFGAWREPGTRALVADALRFSKLRVPPLLALLLFSSLYRAAKKEAWLEV